MNILVLNYEFPPIGGGGSPVSYDISKRLADRGHNIHVVTMKYGDLPVDEDKDGMHIHRVKCLRKQAFVCHPWEQLTYIISAIIYLRKYIKNNHVDVCHTHFIIPTGVVARYLKKKYGIKYVLTAHGSDVLGHNNKRFGALYKILMKPWQRIVIDSRCTVALSDHLKNLICKNMGSKYDEQNVKVIHNGVDTSVYYSSEKEKTILLMGRIQETKGMQDVLSVLTPEILGDWKVKIVGDGPYKGELEKIVHSNKLDQYVEFCGWLESKSPKQLEELSKAAIYVSASHVENCPMTPVEAYCSGCRVILSDIPGHREVMGDRASYFNPFDRESVLAIIKCGLQDRNEASNITNGIQEYETFDWTNRINQYEELLLS